MYFLEIDLRINTTINFKDFKYALEKYELDFDWESGFNEFWDTKNDFGRIFETYEIKENLGGRLPLKIVSFNGKSLFNGDIEKFISELKLFVNTLVANGLVILTTKTLDTLEIISNEKMLNID